MSALVNLVAVIVSRLEPPRPWVRDALWLGMLAICLLLAATVVAVPIVVAKQLE